MFSTSTLNKPSTLWVRRNKRCLKCTMDPKRVYLWRARRKRKKSIFVLRNLSLTGSSSSVDSHRDSYEEVNSNIYGSLSYSKNNRSSGNLNSGSIFNLDQHQVGTGQFLLDTLADINHPRVSIAGPIQIHVMLIWTMTGTQD